MRRLHDTSRHWIEPKTFWSRLQRPPRNKPYSSSYPLKLGIEQKHIIGAWCKATTARYNTNIYIAKCIFHVHNHLGIWIHIIFFTWNYITTTTLLVYIRTEDKTYFNKRSIHFTVPSYTEKLAIFTDVYFGKNCLTWPWHATNLAEINIWNHSTLISASTILVKYRAHAVLIYILSCVKLPISA